LTNASGGAAAGVTIPADATTNFDVGSRIKVYPKGDVYVRASFGIIAASGVKINGVTAGTILINGNHGSVTLQKLAADVWQAVDITSNTPTKGGFPQNSVIVMANPTNGIPEKGFVFDDFQSFVSQTVESTTSRNIAEADMGRLIKFTNTGAKTYNLGATTSIGINQKCEVVNYATSGNLTLQAAGGIVLNGTAAASFILAPWEQATIYITTTDDYAVWN